MREKLIDRMIRIYGFEHEIVIDFVRQCERYPKNKTYDEALSLLVDCHEEMPFGFEEDEDEE